MPADHAQAEWCDREYEDRLLDVKRYLTGLPYKEGDTKERQLEHKVGKHYVVWGGKLLKCTKDRLWVVPSTPLRAKASHFFHDSLGHWSAKTTLSFLTGRYWGPRMANYTEKFVRSCDACQRVKGLPKYKTNLFRPVTGLFEVFSIDFAGPITITLTGESPHILICVERWTGWPIARGTRSATSDEVTRFVHGEVITPFGAPEKIVSYNAGCFKYEELQAFLRQWKVNCKMVLACEPKSNGRATRMVGMVKKSVQNCGRRFCRVGIEICSTHLWVSSSNRRVSIVSVRVDV